MEGKDIKIIFGANIKRLREHMGLEQIDIVNRLNISKTAVSEWESGKKMATAGNLEKLANLFNVPKSALLAEGSERDLSYEKMIKIPIVGRISCGNGALAYEDIEGYEATPKEWLNGGEHFYLRARGDSMINARIQDGDLLLIRKQSDVDDGEIAVVLINDEALLKRVYKRNEALYLQSENPKYPPLICDDKTGYCKIVGKLKKIIINY